MPVQAAQQQDAADEASLDRSFAADLGVMPTVNGTIDDRAARYRTLVSDRKACRRCDGLVNGSVLHDGAFDSTEIGPWTQWLGDLHARLLVVGQDWGDQHAFIAQEGRNDPSATNTMLRELLMSVDFHVPECYWSGSYKCTHGPSGVFLTNAVLCFKKEGGCQGPVRPAFVKTCRTLFLRRQIDLVRPRVVVCLGRLAYEAVSSEYGLPPLRGSLLTVVERPGVELPGGAIAIAVYHCGQRGLRYRNRDAQFEDWKRVAVALRSAE